MISSYTYQFTVLFNLKKPSLQFIWVAAELLGEFQFYFFGFEDVGGSWCCRGSRCLGALYDRLSQLANFGELCILSTCCLC